MPESNNTVKLKGTPILLDRAIQGLQQTLLANLPWLDKAYGRGYKMVQHLDNGSKYVYPAAYVGGSEYVSLTPNDNIGNFCWFDIYDPQTVASQVPAFPTHTYRGALVFWLNLQTIYELDEFINSEEVKSEILSVITTPGAISSGVGRLAVTEVVEGLDSLYKGYTLEHVYSMRNYAEEDLQSLDKQFFMFPYYGVRFEFEITIREVCPTKKAIVSTPIIKEVTLDKNGEYFITADKEGLLLKGVRVEVDTPALDNIQLQEKQVTIAKAKTTEIITPDTDVYGLSKVEVSTNIPLESKQILITENGTTTIEASEGFEGIESVNVDVDVKPNLQDKSIIISENGTQTITTDSEFEGLSSVEVTTDVNTLQGLDFEGIFDQEQANEINQYYKDGIEYARSIVNRELYNNTFTDSEQLIIYPTPYKKTGFLNATFLRCYYLEYFTHAELTALGTTLNDTFNYCYMLKNSPTINCSSITTMNYTFRVCYNLESVTLINISKCNTFNYPFDQCYRLKKCHISQWKQANLSVSSASLLLPESIHYIIQNAVDLADGATARTLILHATAKTNWENSEYYAEDLAILSTKGITIA